VCSVNVRIAVDASVNVAQKDDYFFSRVRVN
jgi:hypothetical protein